MCVCTYTGADGRGHRRQGCRGRGWLQRGRQPLCADAGLAQVWERNVLESRSGLKVVREEAAENLRQVLKEGGEEAKDGPVILF